MRHSDLVFVFVVRLLFLIGVSKELPSAGLGRSSALIALHPLVSSIPKSYSVISFLLGG